MVGAARSRSATLPARAAAVAGCRSAATCQARNHSFLSHCACAQRRAQPVVFHPSARSGQPNSHGRSPRTPRGLTKSRPCRRQGLSGPKRRTHGCAAGHPTGSSRCWRRAATCPGNVGHGQPRAAGRAMQDGGAVPRCERAAAVGCGNRAGLCVERLADLQAGGEPGAQVRKGERGVMCAHFERQARRGETPLLDSAALLPSEA
jgi:hypothetical protein